MSELHQKLYATLAGQVDGVLEYIDKEVIEKSAYDWHHTQEIRTRLQNALQACEDMYIDAEE